MATRAKPKTAAKRVRKGQKAPLPREQLLGLLRQMAVIRRFEEKVGEEYMQGKVRGFCHLYIGQEASAVGAFSVLEPQDCVISHYREHGQALAAGVEPERIMAELFGKATGVSGGRGGSMHLIDVKRNFYGGDAIVAGQLPLAVGMAFAQKYRETGGVVLCFMGDGALNEGAFHESLNLASLWKLPVVFICENNSYGMGTSIERASAVSEAYRRSEAYGIKGAQADGMDVLEVREMVGKAVERARKHSEPGFLEILTYRFVGHSVIDPGKYRTREEIDEWRRRDPLINLSQRMIGWGVLTEAEYEEMLGEIGDQVEQWVTFADESPEPELDTLTDHVYRV